MGSVFWAILRPVLSEVVRIIAVAFTDYLRDRKALADAEAKGRADAHAEAAIEVVAAVERMEAIQLPSDEDVIDALRKGTA